MFVLVHKFHIILEQRKILFHIHIFWLMEWNKNEFHSLEYIFVILYQKVQKYCKEYIILGLNYILGYIDIFHLSIIDFFRILERKLIRWHYKFDHHCNFHIFLEHSRNRLYKRIFQYLNPIVRQFHTMEYMFHHLD
jgi:hypothetical protein